MDKIEIINLDKKIQIACRLDNGDIDALFITSIIYVSYDKAYHKHPVYLCTVYGGTFTSDIVAKNIYPTHTITVSLEEYQSDSFFDILIDQYRIQIGKPNTLIFLRDTPARLSQQLRLQLSQILQEQYTCPYQGGWRNIDRSKSCNYVGTINRYMRTLAEKNPAVFSSIIKPADLLPLNSSLINTCVGIAGAFNQILDRDTRIFLFLYYHYCFTASLFGHVQTEKILCIDTLDPYLRSTVISQFFPVNICESILTSVPKREFLTVYNNTNDIPFIIEELPAVRNSTIGKLESIVNKIAILQRTPTFTNIPRSISIVEENFAVPIVFTEQLHTESSLFHIFLDISSFSSLQSSTPRSSAVLQEYLKQFVTYFPVAFQEACERATLYRWPHIFTIFYTLNAAWERMCSALNLANPLRIHDDPQCIDACNTTEMLSRYLPKISTVKTATPQLFLDTLKNLVNNRIIPKYKRLGISAGECIPANYFNNLTAMPYILENTDSENGIVWGMNLAAIQKVLQNISGQNHPSEVLRMLADNGILELSNINDASYQKRYTVYINKNGQVVPLEKIPLYSVVFPREEILIDPTQNPPYVEPDNLYFKIGKSMEHGSEVYWDFEDEKIPNKHMLITGESGYGKSFFLSRLVKQASEQKLTTVVIHLEGNLPSVDNAIIIDMAEDKPGIDLDNRELYNGETVFSLLQRTYKIKDIHKLMIQGVYDTYARSCSDERSLFTFAKGFGEYKKEYDLTNLNTVKVTKIPLTVQRMWDDIVQNTFYSKDSLRWDRYRYKTIILDFRKYANSPAVLSQLTTIFLTDLYRWQKNQWQTQVNDDHANENHLILVIDEFQKFSTNKDSIINEILREGRKFGLSFWLASQTISSENGSLFRTCATQAGIRVFFNSGKEGNKKISNLLGRTQKQKNYYMKLLDEDLTKGQFLFACSPYPTIPVDGYTTDEELIYTRKRKRGTPKEVSYDNDSFERSDSYLLETSESSLPKQYLKTFDV